MSTYTIERINRDDYYFVAIPGDENADAIILRGDVYAEARQYAESIGLKLAGAVPPPSCDGDCFAEKDDGINHWNLVI